MKVNYKPPKTQMMIKGRTYPIEIDIPVPEPIVIEKEIIKEVIKEVVKEVPIYPNAPESPPDFSTIQSKSGIQQMEFYDAFQRYGVRWPSQRFFPYFTWGGYNTIDAQSFLDFVKFVKPKMFNWWKWTAGNSVLMCVGVAELCSALAHTWYPALAVGMAWGIPAYKAGVSHMFNVFYDIDGKLYLYDAMQYPSELIEFSDERVGLGSTLQVLLML